MKTRLLAAVEPMVRFWLCAPLQADPEEYRSAKRLASFNLAFLFWVTLFAGVYAALGSLRCGLLTISTAVPILASLTLLKCGRSPALCGNVVTLGGWFTLTGLALLNGGLTGPSLLWYSVLPVVAVLTAGVVAGVFWTLLCLLCLLGFGVTHLLGVVLPQELPPQQLAVFSFAAMLGLVVCQFVMAAVRVIVEQRAISALRGVKRELVKTRRQLNQLEQNRGYTAEDWQRLTREHAALTRFVQFKYAQLDGGLDELEDEFDDELDDELAGELDSDDLENEFDDDLDDDDLEDADLDDADLEDDEDDALLDDELAAGAIVKEVLRRETSGVPAQIPGKRGDVDLAKSALQAILRPRA